MASNRMSQVIHQLRRAALVRAAEGATDGELLGRFIERRDEAAFEALVRRHGPMVLGVCRRTLGNGHDADDAFQATFLVLVRRAASIRQRERVGNWLYGVARRTALEARGKSARRLAHERPVAEVPHPVQQSDAGAQEFRALFDQELSRLPDKYRLPLILCDLEGLTRKQAARQLQVPEGTLSSRLATAKRLLAERLTRRGLVPSASALAVLLSESAASAAVPPALVTATVRTTALVRAGPTMPGFPTSAPVATLTERVLKAMLLTRLKSVTLAVLLLAGAAGLGLGMLTYRTARAAQGGADAAAPNAKPAGPRSLERRLADVEKQLQQLLTEVRSLRQELKGKGKPAEVVADGTVFRLRHASAVDAAKILQEVFRGKRSPDLRVVADPRTNSLIVFAAPRLLGDIKKVLLLLDEPAADAGKGESNKQPSGPRKGALAEAKRRLDRAQSKVDILRDRVAWASRMLKKGYLSAEQVKEETKRLEDALIFLDKAKSDLQALSGGNGK
jgi:RNA polymerase sigma factor (sigma-70 family)